ncbi:hypothetical protein CBL_12131 [Carabus blaptoides fortunei]
MQRYHYLLSSLQAEAHKLIENIPVTNENFEVAWNLICNRYNDPKLIAITHTKALLNLSPVNKECPEALRALLNQTWSDWKVAIKKKWREIEKEKNKTCGGPSTSKHLLPIEERLLSFLGNSSVDGDGTTPEAGFHFIDIPIEYIEDMGPSGTSSTPAPPETGTKNPLPGNNTTQPPKKKMKSYEKEILDNKKTQLELFDTMNNKLSDINETLEAKNGILENISQSLIKHNELIEKLINKMQ